MGVGLKFVRGKGSRGEEQPKLSPKKLGSYELIYSNRTSFLRLV